MSTSQLFKVTASALNLRSTPELEPSNRIAVLPEGQTVTKIAVAADDDWWKISTQLKGEDLEGFVAHRFLTSVTSNNPDRFDFSEPVDDDRVVPFCKG